MKKMNFIRSLILIFIVIALGACKDEKLNNSLDWDVQ
ncbi:cytochrome c oxidase assembly protein, partial [Bacillus cereus]